MADKDNIAIKIDHVSKNFILPHEKKDSVKSLFTSFYKKRNKTSEVQHALHDINFEIKEGEFFGIVGRNGSGKSTLLKILAGIYQPTEGNVTTVGKLVPFIELGVGFNPELTGRENVYLNGAILGFSKKEVAGMYDHIVTFSELEAFMDQKLKNYSSGMQVRLAFACATMAEADILLVDEVLAVGDADFQRKCFQYFRKLKKDKKTVVFVTHDMNAVREYCDKALLINDSEVQQIASPEVIAQAYGKLFLGEQAGTGRDPKHADRWGSGAVKLAKISTRLKDDKVVIATTVEATQDVEKLVYGIHVFSTNGKELTATNNRLIHFPDIVDLKAGDKLEITWDILNIFNDGEYLVTATLVDSSGTVFDWYNEATSFRVKRLERSTTAIIPPIDINVRKL